MLGSDAISSCVLRYSVLQVGCQLQNANNRVMVWNNANLIYLISGFSILHLQTDNNLQCTITPSFLLHYDTLDLGWLPRVGLEARQGSATGLSTNRTVRVWQIELCTQGFASWLPDAKYRAL